MMNSMNSTEAALFATTARGEFGWIDSVGFKLIHADGLNFLAS